VGETTRRCERSAEGLQECEEKEKGKGKIDPIGNTDEYLRG